MQNLSFLNQRLLFLRLKWAESMINFIIQSQDIGLPCFKFSLKGEKLSAAMEFIQYQRNVVFHLCSPLIIIINKSIQRWKKIQKFNKTENIFMKIFCNNEKCVVIMKRQRYNKATITFCIAGSRKKREMK